MVATTTSGQPAAILLYKSEGFEERSRRWWSIVHLHELVLHLGPK